MPTLQHGKRSKVVTALRKVRLLAEYEGMLHRVCKLMFTSGDASLYLVPYAASRRFFVGGTEFPEQQVTLHIRTTLGTAAAIEPKLSIHESGQVHIQVPAGRIGPERTLPLSQFVGEHLATVVVDSFTGLPPHKGKIRTTGGELDIVLAASSDSARLVLYANACSRRFAADPDCPIVVKLTRRSLERPLYIGILPIRQAPTQPSGQGVTVLAGWNPRLLRGARQRLLYIRGQ
jgi:hypothetical protein